MKTKLLLAFPAVLAALVSIEIGYRFYLFNSYSKDERLNSATIYSTLVAWSPTGLTKQIADGKITRPIPGYIQSEPKYGFYPPDSDMEFSTYSAEGKRFSTRFHINKMGLVSQNEYSLDKPPNEYRIAVIGQEQTASATANVSWPDHLEARLNLDQNLRAQLGKTFRVLNFGIIDGSFGEFAAAWRNKVKAFSSDLVIINFVETDFIRMASLPPNILRNGRPGRFYPYYFYLDADQKEYISTDLFCSDEPINLKKKHCTLGAPFGLAVDKSIINDEVKIRRAMARLRDEFLSGVIWSGLAPISWRAIFGGAIDPFLERGIFASDETKKIQSSPTVMVEYAARQLQLIHDEHPNVLMLHSANYAEIFVGASDVVLTPPLRFSLTELLMETKPSFKIVDMRKFIPFEKGAPVATIWWHNTAEKWTDAGTEMYAGAVHEAIRPSLVSPQ